MTFLNPLVLLGLAAAAIPILIHLFNFRKPRRVDFSSLQFLREVERQAMRRMRLRQWLLLALRTLAIAFIVLAFARPTVQSEWATLFGARVETASAIVVDNSRSMTLRDSQGELFEQARELASAIAGTHQAGDELFLATTVGGITQRTAFRQAAPAQDAIAGIVIEPGPTRLSSTLSQVGEALAGAGPRNREVVLITDLQSATFADSAAAALPEDTRLILLPLGDRRHANTAVTDARVVSRVLEPGRPIQIEADLVHYGSDTATGVLASLYVEGERVAQASADLQPGMPETVRFTALPRARGWLEATVRLEPDAYEFDNQRFLTLHVPATRRILVARGTGQDTRFLEAALTLGDRASPSASFEITTVDAAALAGTALDAYDVVVLVGPQTIASGVQASIGRFVEDGGGLMVFPNYDQRADLSSLLSGMGVGQYGAIRGGLDGPPGMQFGRTDLQHPLFEGMLEESAQTPRLESPDISAAAVIQPLAGQTLIELDGGQPFLHESRFGRGTVLTLAVAPDPRWSDLPMRGLFVPLMHRSVNLLAAGDLSDESITTGEGGTLRVSGAGEGLTIRGHGTEFVPEQRSTPGGVVVTLADEIEEPGVYDVLDGERLMRRVAVNPDATQSDLTPISPTDAAMRLEALTGAEVQILDAAGGRALVAAEEAVHGEPRVELWRLFLILALLCLLAEMMVAMRWSGTPARAVAA